MLKSSTKIRATSLIFIKLPKKNNLPTDEILPYQVALHVSHIEKKNPSKSDEKKRAWSEDGRKTQ
jgi:hypothetical protein